VSVGCRGIAIVLGLLSLAPGADAALPAVDSIYPAGGQRGTGVAVKAAGKFDPWPVQVWTDSPALRVEVGKAAGALTIHVAKDAAPGPHLLRLYNADGTSALRCFFVGEQREANEAEPNDELAKATAVGELPVTINGQLDKSGDVDGYALPLQKGQCLVASVQGRRLGSGIDPMLHLIDPAGTEVAYAQDGMGLDPLLVYTAPASGTYVVRVSAFGFPPVADVRLAGGKDAAYRLSLTTGPFVRRTLPAGVRRGEKTAVKLVGWNLESDRAEVDATALAPGVTQLFLPIPGGEVRLPISVSDVPEITDARAATRPSATPLPANVSGVIARPGDEAHVWFAARKGAGYTFVARAGTIGSSLDAVLRIEDATGKVLATAGDAPVGGDARLDWAAPADGTYCATIRDLFGRGGSDYDYRLEIGQPGPTIAATADDDAYALVTGKTTAVKVKVVRRNGHSAPLVAVATGLPAGVTATSAEVPATGGEVTLTLTAAADAKPASGAFRILLLGTDPTKPENLTAVFDLSKERDKAGGQAYIDGIPELWLTVSPTALVAPKAAP
jgi:hypothetical protein